MSPQSTTGNSHLSGEASAKTEPATTKMPESILLTGGAGFVGSNLAIHLKEQFPQARIVCMDNLYRKGSELNVPRLQDAGCTFVKTDIRGRDQFPEGPFEYILECSAEPSVLAGYGESPDYLMETNLMGTYQCLEMARQWGSKVIFFSTSRVYPMEPLEQHPWVETETRFEWKDVDKDSGFRFRLRHASARQVQVSDISSRGVKESLLNAHQGSRSLYGFTKYASELLIEEYRQGFGVEAVINRCSVIAGPWQMGKVDQGVVALWVLRHYFKKPLKYIGYGGKGKQVRDMLHIDDLAGLVTRQLAEFPDWEGWCGNVGGGLDVSASLMELTTLCREISGNKIEIAPEPETRQADLRIFMADCEKVRQQHGWAPHRSVEDIVRDIYRWVRENEADLEIQLK
jgi:CDP-paratose 2-epimerase